MHVKGRLPTMHVNSESGDMTNHFSSRSHLEIFIPGRLDTGQTNIFCYGWLGGSQWRTSTSVIKNLTLTQDSDDI